MQTLNVEPNFETSAALSSPPETASENRRLIEAIVNSRPYQEYESAFTELTGLPVTLRPVETWQLPHRGQRKANAFCELLAQKSRACAACLRVQEELRQKASLEPHTVTCAVGLCDTAVPVRLGDSLIGFLHTGQLFLRKPSPAKFDRALQLATEWGVEADADTLREAYFSGKVVPAKQHEAVVQLLTLFAQHLSMLSNQIVVQRQNSVPPVILRAREYIQEHQSEDLSLGQVAKAVNTSTFYFCKIFRKFNGVTFTDYVSRVRIERAKNLLLNPNLRVSEIAFEVGFQSLTHFNRVFRKLLGQSPTVYRSQLAGS